MRLFIIALHRQGFRPRVATGELNRHTDTFNHDDLLNVAELARRAERWIADQVAV